MLFLLGFHLYLIISHDYAQSKSELCQQRNFGYIQQTLNWNVNFVFSYA